MTTSRLDLNLLREINYVHSKGTFGGKLTFMIRDLMNKSNG